MKAARVLGEADWALLWHGIWCETALNHRNWGRRDAARTAAVYARQAWRRFLDARTPPSRAGSGNP